MEKIRAFFALNFDNSTKDKISVIQKELQEKLHNHAIKWENPEKFHLTLRFLGDVEKPVIDDFINDLSGLQWNFKEIRFKSQGIGFFPNSRKPNVVFIGLNETGNNSEHLIKEIDNVTIPRGFAPDKRFIAHITLGRFKREKRASIHSDFSLEFEPFDVTLNGFQIMKSVMDSKGSKYYILKEFNFAK
ncbi:MAG: RNA 2',3'-cyclic phosphodiesterase [Ignavibacteriae bacterium]|nr:MAG: RNA 2',3'-cyclic phosphodiesterase [Ignavibacteriota bacterium]